MKLGPVLPMFLLVVGGAGCAGGGAVPSDTSSSVTATTGVGVPATSGGSTATAGSGGGETTGAGGASSSSVTTGSGVPPIEAQAKTWTWIPIPGTQCLNGDPTGFGISINPDSPNLMIYMEGGGACFNDACDFSAISIPYVPPPDGIFNRSDMASPVRDWSMVYVPYCSGDIYAGDKDTMLGGQVRHFHGYSNIAKFLPYWTATFPHASNVLVTGISAGGFGSALNFAQISDGFGAGPQMTLVDDSGPPFGNEVIPRCLQETYRKVWGLDQTLLAVCGADCPDPDNFATGLIQHVMARYPNAHAGFFSNSQDTVIRTFMGFGWGNGQHDNCSGTPVIVPSNVYADALLTLRSQYATRVGSFLVGQNEGALGWGLGHTVLRGTTYDTTAINGVSVPEWIGQVINGNPLAVGP